MVQNRRSEAEAPHLSSEEEEGSSEEIEEQEGSESEDEDKTSPPTPPVSKKPSVSKKPDHTQTPAKANSSSSDDTGSESDSESDSPPGKSRRANPNVKPIASKPMEDPPKSAKKPRSKPSGLSSPAPAKSAKRTVETEAKESKRAKKSVSDVDDGVSEKKTNGDDSKKLLFQRLWSEDDEIAVLKGMIEYTAKKGADPVADMNAFHDFIKKSLHFDVSKTQLQDKVRRLKKKYENNASKENEGKDRTFSKPHEQKAYELSKKIWGRVANSLGVDNTKVNGTPRKNENQKTSKAVASPKLDVAASLATGMLVVQNMKHSPQVQFSSRGTGNLTLEEEIVRDGLELTSGPKRLELEEKWKKLRVQEVELYLKRVELIREQTKLVLEALKSSEN